MQSNLLNECRTIEQAAALVTSGTAMFTSEQLAAQYAIQATREGEGNVNDAHDLEAHLNFLSEAGAKFDRYKAVQIAQETVNESSTN